MRLPAHPLAASLGLALAVWSTLAGAQHARNFVRTDDEGHLILRFVGTEATGPDTQQMEEVTNAFVSVMVHDRLRADVMFEHEPVDRDWAAATESMLAGHLSGAQPEFTEIDAECRSASCRLELYHANRWSVTDHAALMDVAQRAIQRLIAADDPPRFERVFLLAGYYQEAEPQSIKAYLRRAAVRP